jgi:hypothetical protein
LSRGVGDPPGPGPAIPDCAAWHSRCIALLHLQLLDLALVYKASSFNPCLHLQNGSIFSSYCDCCWRNLGKFQDLDEGESSLRHGNEVDELGSWVLKPSRVYMYDIAEHRGVQFISFLGPISRSASAKCLCRVRAPNGQCRTNVWCARSEYHAICDPFHTSAQARGAIRGDLSFAESSLHERFEPFADGGPF